MSEVTSNVSIQQGSEKSFGIVFSIVFLIVALFPLFNSQTLNYWSLSISAIFLLLAFVAPNILTIPNKLWFKFGALLGFIVTPIVITLVYVFTVMPTGLIMRLLGKDILKLSLNKKSKSYWIERKESMGSMKNQF